MNIALEQTEEFVNGILKNKYGDAFIRGNNGALRETARLPPPLTPARAVLYISTVPAPTEQ